jgi:hypothetical protein
MGPIKKRPSPGGKGLFSGSGKKLVQEAVFLCFIKRQGILYRPGRFVQRDSPGKNSGLD